MFGKLLATGESNQGQTSWSCMRDFLLLVCSSEHRAYTFRGYHSTAGSKVPIRGIRKPLGQCVSSSAFCMAATISEILNNLQECDIHFLPYLGIHINAKIKEKPVSTVQFTLTSAYIILLPLLIALHNSEELRIFRILRIMHNIWQCPKVLSDTLLPSSPAEDLLCIIIFLTILVQTKKSSGELFSLSPAY